jgi:AcrR family transcriptional regulator
MTDQPVINRELLPVPKIVDKEQKKSEIARASIALFARNGFENTTIQEISEAAGIGKGTVYQYFDTKEEIILKAAMEIIGEISQMLAAFDPEEMDPAEWLTWLVDSTADMVDATEDFFTVYMEIWLMYLRSNRYSVSMMMLKEALAEYRMAILRMAQVGMESGLFRRDLDPDSFAKGFAATLDGIAFHYILDKGSFDVRKVSQDFREYLFRGILAPGRGEVGNE